MKTFGEWLVETGIVYSNPTNDARYALAGARSKREGDQPPPMPGPVDADAMYLGTPEDKSRGGKLHKRDRLREKARLAGRKTSIHP